MKDRWIGSVSAPELPTPVLREVLRVVLPGTPLEALRPLSGGFRNHNFEVLTSERYLLRVYPALSHEVHKERRLAELLRGSLETPQYHYVGEVAGRSVALRTFEPGQPLHELLRDPNQADAVLARQVGEALAKIHRIGFERAGELDATLGVAETFDLSTAGLLANVERLTKAAIAHQRLAPELATQLLATWQRDATELSPWTERAVLCHGDFGPTNLLRTARNTLSVLDWEFACAATPAFDFGNLLRPPLEAAHDFQRALADAYTSSGGVLPANWQGLALLADSLAWLQFLTRSECHPLVASDARLRLLRTVASAD